MNKKLTLWVILGLLFSATLISCGNNNDEDIDENIFGDTTTKKVEKKAEIAKDTVAAQVAEEAEEVVAPEEEEKTAEVETGNNDQKYFLISGSFEIKDNADRYLAKLENEGYSPRIIATDFGMYRVAYLGFSDRKEAFNKLNEEVDAGKEVWLCVNSQD